MKLSKTIIKTLSIAAILSTVVTSAHAQYFSCHGAYQRMVSFNGVVYHQHSDHWHFETQAVVVAPMPQVLPTPIDKHRTCYGPRCSQQQATFDSLSECENWRRHNRPHWDVCFRP